jgi:uncharacterized membrane protein
MDPQFTTQLLRFLHILAGLVWIGHLYFFNLTNLPLFKFAIEGGDPNVKGPPSLMLRALFWFRWGAMATLLFGLGLYMKIRKNFVGPNMPYATDVAYLTNASGGLTILLGMLLGIVMWFNVWFIIWPAQKVVLGNNMKIAKGVSDEEKKTLEAQNKPLADRARLASRFNTIASVPMLFFMVFSAHLPTFLSGH